jgi:hypothetical protein
VVILIFIEIILSLIQFLKWFLEILYRFGAQKSIIESINFHKNKVDPKDRYKRPFQISLFKREGVNTEW